MSIFWFVNICRFGLNFYETGEGEIMKKFKSLCFAMVFFMALAMLLPTSAYAAKSAGTIKNNVQVLMEYTDGATVPIPETKVGVKGGLLGTKFLLGSEYHECNDDGKVNFRQTSRITDMYFELPVAWADKVDTEKARVAYRAKLIGNFRYHNYNANITNNKFRVGMPLAWTTVDTTIYLKAKSFNVVFDEGNGSDKTVSKVEYLKKVQKQADPSREGYTFKGWYKENGEVFDFDTPITENITLIGKWEINKYTVKFDSDGGTAVKPQTVEFNKTANKPENPTKEGYTFLGWYKDGNEFSFDNPITETITLTAKWKLKEYSVTFDSNNETQPQEVIVTHGEKVTAPKVEKEGYTFKGWYKEDGEEFNFDTPITDNIILTAKWEINKYTVTFVSGVEQHVESQTVKYGSYAEEPDVELEKENYLFRGWYNGENEFDFKNTPIKADIELTAKWELDTKIGSADVNFFVYNAADKGEMKWDTKYFVPINKNGAYISKAAQLKWDSTSGLVFWGKHYYIEAGKIPIDSVLYDADRMKIDVKKLVNPDWINANMRDKYKNENYELRVYRLTRVGDEPIHVDLAFYDTANKEWVHMK